MTRVRKVAAVGLMTPMAAAAIAVGLSQTADAADACLPLASASITLPTGTVTAGSSVHVSAQVNGLMLLQAHLQISGPGLDEQVGNSVITGPISGDVTLPKPGYFTLAVIGNGTKCAYQTTGFSVKEPAASSKRTHGSTQGTSPHPGGGRHGSTGGAGALPGRSVGGGSAGGNNVAIDPLNGSSPFSLPPVAPDGSAQGFEYPTPDPQIASPPSRPVARNVSDTTNPVKWGPSLAIALVLLVISAHLGMWSRRQRLAAEGARPEGRGNGRRPARRHARGSTRTMAATATADAGAVTGAPASDDSTAADGTSAADGTALSTGPITMSGRAAAGPPSAACDSTETDEWFVPRGGIAASDSTAMTDRFGTRGASATNDELPHRVNSKGSSGRGYQGRRRRS